MTERLTTQELCNAVYATVRAAEKPLTRKEVAERIGHKKAPHISRMLEHLASTGWMWKYHSQTKFGVACFTYFIPDVSHDGDPCELFAETEAAGS